MIKNRQIIFPKVIYRTPPENAFMNVYFYFYSVVKCGNRALGINERIKKIFLDTKTNPNPPLSRSDRGPSGGPVPKGFRKRAPSGQLITVTGFGMHSCEAAASMANNCAKEAPSECPVT
jgi:hypothetical protein